MRGISLIEVLIGVVLSSIIVLALYEMLVSQERVYGLQDDVAEMQQNLRAAVEKISRDLMMAGFGRPKWTTVNCQDSGSCTGSAWCCTEIPNWYNAGNAYKPVSPVSGTAGTINIIGCLDTAQGNLATSVTAGATSITLKTGQTANFKKDGVLDPKKADISIGGMESARITEISGNVLTIDTSVTTGGLQGLVNGFASDTEIYIVRVISYFADTDSGVPVLRINEHRGAGNQQLCQFITGLSATVSGNVVDFTVSGRTRNPDRTTGNYVESQINGRVILRN